MIHSKTYTEKELYVDDIDQTEDDTKCNTCEKEFPRLAISWDIKNGLKKWGCMKLLLMQNLKYLLSIFLTTSVYCQSKNIELIQNTLLMDVKKIINYFAKQKLLVCLKGP